MKPFLIGSALVLVCSVTGCQNLVQPSRGYTDLATSQIKSIDAISKSVQSLELSVTQNKQESQARIAQLEKEAAIHDQTLSNAVNQINTANQKYQQLVAGLAGAASKTFTGTDIGGNVANAFFTSILGSANSNIVAQAAATDTKLQQVAVVAKTDADAAKAQAVETIKTQFPTIASQNGVGPEKISQLQSKTDQLDGTSSRQTYGLVGTVVAALAGGSYLTKKNRDVKAAQDLHTQKVDEKLKLLDEHDDLIAELNKKVGPK